MLVKTQVINDIKVFITIANFYKQLVRDFSRIIAILILISQTFIKQFSKYQDESLKIMFNAVDSDLNNTDSNNNKVN